MSHARKLELFLGHTVSSALLPPTLPINKLPFGGSHKFLLKPTRGKTRSLKQMELNKKTKYNSPTGPRTPVGLSRQPLHFRVAPAQFGSAKRANRKLLKLTLLVREF